MHPSQTDWDNFYGLMLKKSGLDLAQYKANQLQRRIITMAQSKGSATLNDFWTSLTSTPDGIEWFMDKLAINVSELFRNPEKWTELGKHILPSLKQGQPGLKCWSAGCSYGAEAHTLSIILDELVPGRHSILCTDIDTACLEQAKRGEFNDADLRCVPPDWKKKYFVQEEGRWMAQSGLRQKMKFKKHNLLADNFEPGFDLIVCRNVVIYFTDPAKHDLYQKFFNALKPGGILFVGGTERISSAELIGYVSDRPFFYKKPEAAQKTWRNAS